MPAFSGAHRAAVLFLSASSLLACSQTPVTVTLHSLQASGEVSFVCQADDGSGLKLDECPDYEAQRRRILGLVTQTSTNEVAVVDLRDGEVVDLDPSVPGYEFARVGGRPGSIVSSPGGRASFVGVSGLQKNGVFALPTTCMTTPQAGQPTRDLTSWAACALSSAPGEITMLVDPTNVGDATSPLVRAACGSTAAQQPADQSHHPECQADLTTEEGPFGRRKLLVALPEEHKLVLLDAQSLLDRMPGKFDACTIEATYPLQADLPSDPVAPELPEDLVPTAGSSSACVPTIYPPSSATAPTPAGMALEGNSLYVADSTLPAVHVIDVTDPCAPKEGPPLLPHSYIAPSRVVTTSRVAVSPLTPAGKQYVYAIDRDDQPASVMVFDVSPGVKSRTPMIFPGAPRQPFSVPDRLKFNSPVKDLKLVMRDFPAANPSTGVGQFGTLCDPNPDLDPTAAGAQYRPNSDFTSGAIPFNLRGVFGFLMLENGQVPIVDVEDFDANCRRPIFKNPSSVPDFRGCANDPDATNVPYYTLRTTAEIQQGQTQQPDDTATVTNESSCQIVEPNRPRAASLSRSDSTVGLHAPTLRSLPQFSNPDPSTVLTAADQPHMLAVSFDGPNPTDIGLTAQVNINGQLYTACANQDSSQPVPCNLSAQQLQTDPNTATLNSLTLPLIEPRSYVATDNPTLTYEGRVLPLPDRTSGFLEQESDGTWILQDPDAAFCSGGVEDSDTIKEEGTNLGIPASALDAWSTAHADYVQITGDFLPAEDTYWHDGAGKLCANGNFSNSTGRDSCIAEFGGIASPTALNSTRELTILQAYTDHLVVTARNQSTVEDIKCCFPTGTAYTVRASHQWYLNSATSFHDIAVGPDHGRCVHTAACDPRKKFFHARAFEVCNSSAAVPDGTADADKCALDAANVGCVRDFTNGAVVPRDGKGGSECIFENLTSRFVVYRGTSPSSRDMQFGWGTTGGFNPLSMSLASLSSSVSPQSMVYLPELGYMAVIDGSTLGLALFDLNSLGVVAPSPLY